MFKISFLLFFIITTFSHAFAAVRVVKKNSTNFSINERMLVSNTIYFSSALHSPGRFQNSPLRELDVENWAGMENTRILASKAFFIIDRPLDSIDENIVHSDNYLKTVFHAETVDYVGPFTKHLFVPKDLFAGRPISLSFDITNRVYQASDYIIEESIDAYIDVIRHFDLNLPPDTKYFYSMQEKFSTLFYNSMMILKAISYGEKTIIIAYSVARLRDSSCSQIDSIPFITAEKALVGEIKKTIVSTYNLL